MHGLMQDWPLLVHTILDHAALNHAEREMVTRSVEGPIRRCTMADLRTRSLRVAKALQQEGVRLGDRVATMAWNTDRHVETWYGIMGLGAICHTLNPRLFAEQLVYIINHAEDRLLFVDLTFLPVIQAIRDQLPTVEKVIVLTDEAHLPADTPPGTLAYESWLDQADDDFAWARFDENTAAALCYTSGTTGNPKGALQTHRGCVNNVMNLAFWAGCLAGTQVALGNAKPEDFENPPQGVSLITTPLFHVTANNCAAQGGTLSGGKLVLIEYRGEDPRVPIKRLHKMTEQQSQTEMQAAGLRWVETLDVLPQQHFMVFQRDEACAAGGAAES